MNNKSYIVLARYANGEVGSASVHPYTRRCDAESKAYEYATQHTTTTYYVAEIQTKYKATDVVVTELT